MYQTTIERLSYWSHIKINENDKYTMLNFQNTKNDKN